MADQPLESINISLPRAMAEFVDKRVQGRFGNRSEYIRSLIREDEERQRRATLEQILLDGLHSGPGRELTPDAWADMKREIVSKLKGNGASA